MLGRRGGKVLNWKRWREACLARVKGESEVKNGVKRWLPLIFYLLATTCGLRTGLLNSEFTIHKFDLPNVAKREDTLPVEPHW